MINNNASHTRFYRLGLFAARRKWWVMGAWFVALVALGPQLGKMTDRMSSGGFEVPGSQSDRVTRILKDDFSGKYQFSDLLVLHSDELRATDSEYRAAFLDVKTALEKSPGIGEVSDPYATPQQSISAHGRTMTASVGLTDDQDQALKHNDEVEAAIEEAAQGHDDVQVLITGAAPFYSAFEETTTHDLERAERIAFPITLLILLFAFGSLVAAGMPLLMAIVALGLSFGLISIMAANWTTSIFTQNIASMIGLGVGIDYSLFMLSRFRERLRAEVSVPQAIAETMASSGKAVFVSALTVVVSLSGTLLVNLQALRSMGVGAMIAVAIAGAAALTFLPAVLVWIGPKVNSLRVGPRRDKDSRMWHRWAVAVMDRPWAWLGISVLILVALAAPALDLNVGSSGPEILPPDAKPRIAAEITAEAFGEGQVAPAQVVIRHQEGVLDGGFGDVYAAAAAIAKEQEVVRVDSIATLAPGANEATALAAASSPAAEPFIGGLIGDDGKTTLLSVVTRHGAQSEQSNDLVTALRQDLPSVV
ncbi:MAG: MMPL family transporter, partial [Actinomycetota bacterium]